MARGKSIVSGPGGIGLLSVSGFECWFESSGRAPIDNPGMTFHTICSSCVHHLRHRRLSVTSSVVEPDERRSMTTFQVTD